MTLRELGRVENLPQRLPIVLAAAGIAGAAIALGQLILRALGLRSSFGAAERIPLAFGLGATGLGVATLVVGRPSGLAPWPIRAGLGLIIADRGGLPGPRSPPSATASTAPKRPRATGRRVGVRAGRRPVPDAHGAGGDAADDRLRRDRVPPARPEGVFPGGPDRVPAAQRLHEHAVRRGDAPPARHGGPRRLVARGAGRPAPRGVLRAGDGGADRPDRRVAWASPRAGVGRGGGLPDDPLGLPARRRSRTSRGRSATTTRP